jgi:hypothetical protein
MIKKSNEGSRPQPKDELDRCYGSIGISAVAAAVRYQSDAKNPAYAPAAANAAHVREDEAA